MAMYIEPHKFGSICEYCWIHSEVVLGILNPKHKDWHFRASRMRKIREEERLRRIPRVLPPWWRS
jgi:hypothetical protein